MAPIERNENKAPASPLKASGEPALTNEQRLFAKTVGRVFAELWMRSIGRVGDSND